jgi:hypothetical protein
MTTYEAVRREHEEHLRKLPPIRAAIDRAMARCPEVTADEIRAAVDEERTWQEKLSDICRREHEAARATRGRGTEPEPEGADHRGGRPGAGDRHGAAGGDRRVSRRDPEELLIV